MKWTDEEKAILYDASIPFATRVEMVKRPKNVVYQYLYKALHDKKNRPSKQMRDAVIMDATIQPRTAASLLGLARGTILNIRHKRGVANPRYWQGCEMTCPAYCPYDDCMMPQDIAVLEDEDEMRARAMAAMKPIRRKRKAV